MEPIVFFVHNHTCTKEYKGVRAHPKITNFIIEYYLVPHK